MRRVKEPFSRQQERPLRFMGGGRLEKIPARIGNAVMMLTPEERENRAIVNETVRTQTTPSHPAGSADRMACRGRRSELALPHTLSPTEVEQAFP
jgi:hypothetical protein